jgi:DNA-binding SARP family transcriptional activator/tetratricopeptide (TPR) repeat protein
MRFGVLGSLQVTAGDCGEPGDVLATRLRVLLAVLLWRANQAVPAGELAELVWDGAPPAGAPDAVRALVMRLRRRLDPRAAARIVTRAPGYAIEISGDELDASRFETLTRKAGAAVRAGQWAQAARTATDALGLWRGVPLADIPSQLLRDQWVPHLDQLHLQALDWRIEGDLHDGRHEQIVPELGDLTARHPLREHFHSQLMLALYRCARQAEALAAYQHARDVLVTELGVEPGPGLRDLHRRILAADPALAVTGPASPAEAEPQQGRARELPPAMPGFTGRSAELEALSRLLGRPGEQIPGTVVISAIGGTGGLGKTALALHWAHPGIKGAFGWRLQGGQLSVEPTGLRPDCALVGREIACGRLGMRFSLLGPLMVADGAGVRMAVAGPRVRVLLAALLLHANVPVPAGELAELVWDGSPPSGAVATLRSYVRRLRRVLDSESARITFSDPGYVIRVEPAELDVLEFEALCRDTRSALRAGKWADAAAAAVRALGLWRAAPLLDVPAEVLRLEFVPRLERLRLQVLEDRFDAGFRLGHHQELIPQLLEVTVQHPLRERFHAQLMLALAHSGRRAEALTAYQDARKMLVAELGVEPGHELRALHEQILAGDEALPDAPGSGGQALARSPAGEVPRQLPAAAGHFTGRGAELADLADLADLAAGCDSQAAAGDTVVISAIDGMAGIGKTALAVHAAHRVSGQFPDGQLFVDLHGYTRDHPPREPGDALGMLLRGLQVPAQRIPEDTQERAALYRQRLAGTRTLVLLDNAADEAQVRPLLPAAPGCLVLVTSRRRLKGLDDARSVSLDLLTPRDAVKLLHAVAGPGRVPADDPLLDEIAHRCGRLPLALRIAGALLRHRPAWSPKHLAALLRDEDRRVPALSDGERDLATVFDLSYTGLSGRHQRLLRRLGLVPGPDADAYAAAALLDTGPDTATGLLEDLVDHNLLIAHAPGRYRLHDLIRAHARTLAATDPSPERDAALDRLLRYYAHTAHRASIPTARRPRPAPGGPAPVRTHALPDPGAARAWLRTERDNLEQAHTHAHIHNLHEHTLTLAAGLAEILRTDGPYARALAVHQAAADTAHHHSSPTAHANALTDLGIMRRLAGDLTGALGTFSQALEIYRATGDRLGEADTLAELGRAGGLAGDLTGGVSAFSRALEIYRATGDRHGEADMLADLGIMRRVSGDLTGAIGVLGQALEFYRATSDRHGEAHALTELGRAQALSGDLAGADRALGQALEFYRATSHHHSEAYVLTNLGTVRRLTGDLAGAGDALGQALEIYRTIGYGQGEAEALANLGITRRLAGDLAGAGDAQATALEIYRKIGSRHDEAWALNHYAATIADRGDLPRALALYQQALAMNRELNKPDGQAIALEGLGECHLTAGETQAGAAHLRQALEIYQHLGMAPDAERVRTRLAGLTTV